MAKFRHKNREIDHNDVGIGISIVFIYGHGCDKRRFGKEVGERLRGCLKGTTEEKMKYALERGS